MDDGHDACRREEDPAQKFVPLSKTDAKNQRRIVGSSCVPFKSPKHHGAPRRSANNSTAKIQLREEDSHGQEARKPKHHGKCLGGEDREFVRGAGKEARREGEVRNGE